MNIVNLLEEHHVPYWTEGKNVSQGWIAVQCPFCDDTSNHLGYNLERNYFKCWKCGFHKTWKTLARLLHIEGGTVGTIIRQYGGHGHVSQPVAAKAVVRLKTHRLPGGVVPLLPRHRQYLESRNFDPDQLARLWYLQSTGPLAFLDRINYRFRIVIPIMWDGKRVSFTTRDVTDKHELRYITCPGNREIIHHKYILYGRQQDWLSTGIVVEGPTDVWRFGTRAVATFGIEYRPEQVQQIYKNFKRVFIVFDDEPQAQIQAEKLVDELRYHGCKAYRREIVGDPGSMDQREANLFVKDLLG